MIKIFTFLAIVTLGDHRANAFKVSWSGRVINTSFAAQRVSAAQQMINKISARENPRQGAYLIFFGNQFFFDFLISGESSSVNNSATNC